jgi:TRAP-type mannitol/chloroaromatic compound transport system permease small subunit
VRVGLIVQTIDRLNEYVGRTVSWLAMILVFTTFFVATLRYGFSVGWVWMQEIYVRAHAIIFLAAAAYALKHEAHVRIDVYYGPASPRAKAWVNLLGTLFFLYPFLGLVWWTAYPYVRLSWTRLETSQEAGGMPGLFLLKSCMLVFVVLLALQGVALILRSAMILRGKRNWELPKRANETDI